MFYIVYIVNIYTIYTIIYYILYIYNFLMKSNQKDHEHMIYSALLLYIIITLFRDSIIFVKNQIHTINFTIS